MAFAPMLPEDRTRAPRRRCRGRTGRISAHAGAAAVASGQAYSWRSESKIAVRRPGAAHAGHPRPYQGDADRFRLDYVARGSEVRID
jgi:hypothetical protein